IPMVLDDICRLIESQRKDLRASILRLDPGSRRLRHGAAPSLPKDYVRAIDGIEIGPRAGSCGAAAYRKALVVVEDIAKDPLWDVHRHLALQHELRVCWSWPVLDCAGELLATFAVYHAMPRAPRPDELELVARAAQITRIALEHDQATIALRRSEQQYRALVTSVPVVTWMTDDDGR